MKLQIKLVNLPDYHKDEITKAVTKYIDSMDRYNLIDKDSIQVHLNIENVHSKEFIMKLNVHTNKGVLNATSKADSLLACIDNSFEKIDSQLYKIHDKQ